MNKSKPLGMLNFSRRFKRVIASAFIGLIAFPVHAIALPSKFAPHGGDSPEMGTFSPVEASEWVNKFSGDFSYNIPLFEIGGYPVNIAYNSDVRMESAASWVGLGWSLNPGSVSRSMRGLPDEFLPEKDQITQIDRRKNHHKYSLGLAGKLNVEILGKQIPKDLPLPGVEDSEGLSTALNVFYSNYTGIGFDMNIGFGLSVQPTKEEGFGQNIKKVGLNGSISLNTEAGISTSFGASMERNKFINSASFTTQRSTSSPYGNGRSSSLMLGHRFGSAAMVSSSSAYLPFVKVPSANLSLSGQFDLGGEIYFVFPNASITGSYSKQSIGNIFGDGLLKRKLKPVGLLNYIEREHYNQNEFIYDFNRENEFPLKEYAVANQLAFTTHDYFSVSAQGIGGTYRVYRSSPVTMVSDGKVFNNGGNTKYALEGVNIGAEAGGGNLFKIGANVGVRVSEGWYGGWEAKHLPGLDKKGVIPSIENSLYRPNQIKQVGTFTGYDNNLYASLMEDEAVYLPLSESAHHLAADIRDLIKGREKVNVKAQFSNGKGSYKSLLPNYRQANRQVVAQPFNYYTADEAFVLENKSLMAGTKVNYFKNPAIDVNGAINFNSPATFNRNSNGSIRKGHHLSMVKVNRADGYVFNFGLPAYNVYQSDVSFKIDNATFDSGSMLSVYKIENSLDTRSGFIPEGGGVDHFYSSKAYSPFAHSYLLTSIVSPTYFDLDGNGFSSNDLGDYVEFQYGEYRSITNPYKWKIPSAYKECYDRTMNESSSVDHLFANHNEVRNSLKEPENSDDMASYRYGEKEVWYVKKMMSKEHVAVFHISPSASFFDRSLLGEHMAYSSDQTDALAKLDSIQVFTKEQYNNGDSPEKTVHFAYNYELCRLDGRDPTSGKLTLKKIHFTFRDSKKSAFSEYLFDYGFNPNYSVNNTDAWGYYKNFNNPPNPSGSILSRPDNVADQPYVDQTSRQQADINASAWLLSHIDLPTGGAMDIVYESDDYGFVQNKMARQTFQIAGFGKSANGSKIEDQLYGSGGNNPYVFVNLSNYSGNKIGTDSSPLDVARNYWYEATKGMDQLPMKVLVDVTNKNNYEYYKVYAALEENNRDVVSVGGINYGYLKLKMEPYSKNPNRNEINPISRRALQIARQDFYPVIFRGKTNSTGVEKILRSLVGFAKESVRLVKGLDKTLVDRGFGKKIISSKSVLAVNSPYQSKLGGGARVKTIQLFDSWDQMTNGMHEGLDSRWEYSYTKELSGSSSGHKLISSGVAEWEPANIDLENPVVEAKRGAIAVPKGLFGFKEILEPDAEYNYAPFGQTVFPTPNVGYEQVTVEHFGDSEAQELPALGKSIYNYHTAAQFPVVTDYTEPEFIKHPKRMQSKFKYDLEISGNYMVASQGFSILLNDMHGKPAFEKQYRSTQSQPYSTKEYLYNLNASSYPVEINARTVDKLNNNLTVINNSGEAFSNNVSLDFDLVIDSRESFETTKTFPVGANLDVAIIGLGWFGFPLPIPGIKKLFAQESNLGRCITATKTITKYGVLMGERIEVEGASNDINYLAFDETSGQPILKESNNEFKDHLYGFDYPAYWMYPNMRSTDEREGLILGNLSWDNSGTLVGGFQVGGEVQLYPGDILMALDNSIAYSVFEKTNGSLALAAKRQDGILNQLKNSGSGKFKVIATGSQNLVSKTVGSVTSKLNPFLSGSLNWINNPVVAASAQTFKHYDLKDESDCQCNDQMFYSFVTPEHRAYASANHWLPDASFTFKNTPRSYSLNTRHEYNMREDGVYKIFDPFWKKSNGDFIANSSQWLALEKITEVNNFGKPLETINPLDQATHYRWGFNQTQLRLKTFNMDADEGLYEDFEFVTPNECSEKQLIFEPEELSKGHTGRSSIKVEPNNSKVFIGGVYEK